MITLPAGMGYGSGKGKGASVLDKGSKIRSPFKHALAKGAGSSGGKRASKMTGRGRYKGAGR